MNSYNRIPQEMCEYPQWVGYQLQERAGKATKVPINPGTSKLASSTDPATWGTFDQACEAVARWGLDGVGFVFSEDDPYTGIDLDKVGDPKTGQITSWAADIVGCLDSYTEWSQSRLGLHIIANAKLPPRGRRKGQIEMYDQARFFVMTGFHIPGTPRGIELRQQRIEVLYREVFGSRNQLQLRSASPPDAPVIQSDHALIRHMLASKHGYRLRPLWRGDISAYDSHSEADMALVDHLAWWCRGDTSRIDRLFRRSGLYRDKWDTPHYGDGSTYGEGLIARVIGG